MPSVTLPNDLKYQPYHAPYRRGAPLALLRMEAYYSDHSLICGKFPNLSKNSKTKRLNRFRTLKGLRTRYTDTHILTILYLIKYRGGVSHLFIPITGHIRPGVAI